MWHNGILRRLKAVVILLFDSCNLLNLMEQIDNLHAYYFLLHISVLIFSNILES
jgi:hypothetical protein